MKHVFNVALAACALMLIYVCYASIMGPINFEKEKSHREQAVISRLIDIRKAQMEYRNHHKGEFAGSFDTLVTWVKTAKLPLLYKAGELTDKQLEEGLTDAKAVKIINKAKKTGNYSEVKKLGLEGFVRDTIWVAALDTLFGKNYIADSMAYVPFGNGKIFEIATKNDTAKSGAPVFMFEVKTPYESYMGGMDRQEIINLKDVQTKLGRYCGLKIGSIENPNNGEGNWE